MQDVQRNQQIPQNNAEEWLRWRRLKQIFGICRWWQRLLGSNKSSFSWFLKSNQAVQIHVVVPSAASVRPFPSLPQTVGVVPCSSIYRQQTPGQQQPSLQRPSLLCVLWPRAMLKGAVGGSRGTGAKGIREGLSIKGDDCKCELHALLLLLLLLLSTLLRGLRALQCSLVCTGNGLQRTRHG